MTPPRPACSYMETVGVPCEYPPGLLDQPSLPATGTGSGVLLAAIVVTLSGFMLRKVSA